jgi:hypothetical protein
METAASLETLVNVYQTARLHILGEHTFMVIAMRGRQIKWDFKQIG